MDKYEVANEDMLKKFLRESALNNERLYHYTTFESLLKIIKEKSFRLTRLDLLNDKAEINIGNPMDRDDCYIMSFTDEDESPAMWEIYGKPSGIKIRLDFDTQKFWEAITGKCYYLVSIDELKCDENGDLKYEKKEERCYISHPKNLFGINKPLFAETMVLADIVYFKKKNNVFCHNGEELKNFKGDMENFKNMKGFIKYSAWDYEKEKRLRLLPNIELSHSDESSAKRIDKPKYIYVEFDQILIEDFHITFNPWISPELRNEIEISLNRNANEYDLTYSNSVLYGEVDEL